MIAVSAPQGTSRQNTPPAPRQPSDLRRRLFQLAALLASALIFPFFFLHLAADFPHNTPWMDWAKYTDEGWYGDAAIRLHTIGHWYVRGDFNPAAALPTWPLLEAAVFHLTGATVIAARALSVSVFAGILLAGYLLLRRSFTLPTDRPSEALAPAAAVLLLVANPFSFAFMRMAILEPLLILLTLLALLAASALTPFSRRTLPAIALGLLLPAIVLTKTTGLFLFPAIAFLGFARCAYSLRRFLRPALLASGIGLSVWLAYFALLAHAHLLLDFHYLFSANAYTGFTLAGALSILRYTIRGGMWTGRVLFPLGFGLALAACLLPPLRRRPVAVTLALWALGYGAFLAYHDNLQPRYYTVVAVPLTLLIPLALEHLWQSSPAPAVRLPILAATALLALNTAQNARETIHLALTPRYTFLHAAQQIARIINRDPAQKRLLLSISGSDISLMTGIPSICDDYGTMDLDERVSTYRPGWYAVWNQIDDDKMDALDPLLRPERVAAIPAYDDPERNLLILYRLVPATAGSPHRRHTRKPVPRQLRTTTGQQPSANQLQH